MSVRPSRPAGNWLLDALPDEDYGRLLKDLQPVSFPLGEVIYEPGSSEMSIGAYSGKGHHFHFTFVISHFSCGHFSDLISWSFVLLRGSLVWLRDERTIHEAHEQDGNGK